MKLVADRVEMVQSWLRDEIVWRDDSAEADGLKPTATFGGHSATTAKNQRVIPNRRTRHGSPEPTALSVRSQVGSAPASDRSVHLLAQKMSGSGL